MTLNSTEYINKKNFKSCISKVLFSIFITTNRQRTHAQPSTCPADRAVLDQDRVKFFIGIGITSMLDALRDILQVAY